MNDLTPAERQQAERVLAGVIDGLRAHGRDPTAAQDTITAVFMRTVLQRSGLGEPWAQHLTALATARRWPDFSAVLQQQGIEPGQTARNTQRAP